MDYEQLDYFLDEVTKEKESLVFEIDVYKYAVETGKINVDKDVELEFELRAEAILDIFNYLKQVKTNSVNK